MAIADLVATIRADASQFTAGLAQVQAQMRATAHRVQEAGTAMGVALGAAGAAVGLALGSAVVKAADFEAQIDRVGAIAGATGSEFDALKKAALDLGASTSKSATEVAVGMEQMAAAGFEVNEIIAAMPGIIAAAEASGEDMARVTEVVTAALNSFGLEAQEASRVADIMAEAANRSAASVDDMGYAFKYAGPVAKQLGFDIEWLAAAVGVMTDAGLEGSQAGTTLRMALSRLANPPKAAAEALREMGVALTDANGKARPVPEVLADVMNALRGMSKEQRIAAAQTLFGTEAMSGMLVLAQEAPKDFEGFVNALKNSGGAAQRTAEQMKDNLKGSLEELSGAFETLQISIGDALAPAIRAIADGMQVLVNWFNSLPGPVKSFLAIASAIIGVLLILGSVISFAVAGLGAMAAALGVTIGTVAVAIGWIAAIVAAVVGIGAALVYAYNKVGWFRDAVNQAWANIKAGFQAVVDFLRPAVQAVVDFVVQQWERIKSWWGESGGTIIQAVQNVWSVISTIISTAANIIWSIMQFVWPAVKTLIVSTWENIKGVISGAIGVILSVIDIFANLFTGNWKGLWNSIVNLLKSAVQLIWNLAQLWFIGKTLKLFTSFGSKALSLFKNAWNSVSSATKSFLSNIWNAISSRLSSIASNISSRISSIKSYFSSGFNSIVSTVKSAASSIQSRLSSLASQALSWGKNLVSMFAKGITSRISAVVSAAKNVAAKVKSFLGFSSPTEEGPASNSDEWAPNFMKMFASGINKNIPLVQRAATKVAAAMQAVNNTPVGYTASGLSVSRYGYASPAERADIAGGVVISGNTFVVRNDQDIRRIGQELDRQKRNKLRAKGWVTP